MYLSKLATYTKDGEKTSETIIHPDGSTEVHGDKKQAKEAMKAVKQVEQACSRHRDRSSYSCN